MADPYCLQRQTQAKHELLRHYLKLWARVLSQAGHADLMYVDGFSFAGWYTSDEDGGPGGPGSPLIAVEALADDPVISARGNFAFIEREAEYAAELEQNLETRAKKRSSDRVRVASGPFVKAIERPLAWLESQAREGRRHRPGSEQWVKAIVPVFVFIDPYGVAGFPMALVARILALPRSETFINLMWVRTALNLNNPGAQDSDLFTEMFGTDAWRKLTVLRGEELRRAFHDLYLERLRAKDGADAKFVRSFEMCGSDGAVVYWMVFCTNSVRGLEKMKEAMWQVDPGGRFQYRDTTARNQTVLFGALSQVSGLRRLLVERFAGQGPVRVEDVIQFVIVETPYLPKHVKPHLRDLETDGALVATRKANGRAGTFPDGTVVSFLPVRN